MQQLVLLPESEYKVRVDNLRALMQTYGFKAILITDNANKFYVSGRVFAGYIYLPLKGEPIFFVRRPVELEGDGTVYIRKPEQMPETIGALNMPDTIGLELDLLPYSMAVRMGKIFEGAEITNCSPMLREARSVKTEWEIGQLRLSGEKQSHVYKIIPRLYQPGMTDIELQVEIERQLRLEGCLGQFRISGDSMELFMGSLLVGENADNPTPYDFAMGGAGINPSIPGGANGTMIRRGNTVMVDMNGDFTGYMTDMTRTFALGTPESLAQKAHQLSIDICHTLAEMARPGMEAKALYEKAEEMVKEANLLPYFMGHRQKAGFIGHGVGIEVNELPVISPRSRDVLKEGNVIALEPKFVIPSTGAAGIENTYVVTAAGLKPLVDVAENIIDFED